MVNGVTWLKSHISTAFRSHGEWLTHPNSLKMSKTRSYSGFDEIGAFSAVEVLWNSTTNHFFTTIFTYPDRNTIIFEQYFPKGAVETSLNDNTDVQTFLLIVFLSCFCLSNF